MKNQSVSKYYFHLQYLRLVRMFKDNGIYPWLVVPLSLLLFVALTIKLLNNFAFGEFIYLFIATSIAFPLTNQDRLGFLKSISIQKNYYRIRLIEQAIIILPFIIGLLFYKWLGVAVLLFFIGLYFSFGKFNYNFPYSIPTPFGSRPFEFPAGIRKNMLFVILAYSLVPIGLSVDNFNLALASIPAIGFIVGGFHAAPEPRFYIWIFKLPPKEFLKHKALTILRYTLLLILPPVAVLSFYNLESVLLVSAISLAAISFAVMCMLSKYVSYPQEINLIQGLAMGGGILFPPIMLVIIPWFYFKALKGLQPVLK